MENQVCKQFYESNSVATTIAKTSLANTQHVVFMNELVLNLWSRIKITCDPTRRVYIATLYNDADEGIAAYSPGPYGIAADDVATFIFEEFYHLVTAQAEIGDNSVQQFRCSRSEMSKIR